MYPWGRLSVTIPISQIGHFQFVFGAWIASVCHSVLCLSMGAVWGGCDDASGPVLVWEMTNGFRKLQSPPLGGAIPSAVSPEEADTLQHREMVQGTSLNDGLFFFFARHVTYKNAATTQHRSVSVSATVSLRNFPEWFYKCLCGMPKPSPYIWTASTFSASPHLFIICLGSCYSKRLHSHALQLLVHKLLLLVLCCLTWGK